jgi:hypothetical protein
VATEAGEYLEPVIFEEKHWLDDFYVANVNVFDKMSLWTADGYVV